MRGMALIIQKLNWKLKCKLQKKAEEDIKNKDLLIVTLQENISHLKNISGENSNMAHMKTTESETQTNYLTSDENVAFLDESNP